MIPEEPGKVVNFALRFLEKSGVKHGDLDNVELNDYQSKYASLPEYIRKQLPEKIDKQWMVRFQGVNPGDRFIIVCVNENVTNAWLLARLPARSDF